MRSNYRFNEQMLERLKQYLEKQDKVQVEIKEGLRAVKVHLRSVVAVDIKSHPRLLFIYNQFQKLKDLVEQQLQRKEQLLFPFLYELTHDEVPGEVINGKAVTSFFKVFSTENDRIKSVLASIDEAAGNYAIEASFPPSLKKAFVELRSMSAVIKKVSDDENALFIDMQQSQKHPIISKIRRA